MKPIQIVIKNEEDKTYSSIDFTFDSELRKHYPYSNTNEPNNDLSDEILDLIKKRKETHKLLIGMAREEDDYNTLELEEKSKIVLIRFQFHPIIFNEENHYDLRKSINQEMKKSSISFLNSSDAKNIVLNLDEHIERQVSNGGQLGIVDIPFGELDIDLNIFKIINITEIPINTELTVTFFFSQD